ncbi:PQ loop repeat protein [Pleurostoma richardsiae]|uniref:PQ loop repeat protein n=1 Tax=Pleurostoma richardsiae TaxID=41990 RepID=A0AA38VLB0_9PEZI|nr:PQ loop repeat protein [Pleurostoma richardsiae]
MDALISPTRCDELRQPGFVNLVVSVIILIGLLISYLPQHYRIISRGTSEGISPWFVLLGTTSATAGFANILTLPQSRQDVACCKELETFQCVAGLLGIAQLGVQWVCFAFIFVLFLVFFRYDSAILPEDELTEAEVEEAPRWQTAVTVAVVCLLHGLLVIVLTVVFALVIPDHMSGWANALGLMAAALAAVQYIPQIWTTYHLKHVGSLSIPMMCIQTPGGFVFAGSLFARLGWGGWSSWGIFLLTATMQGILLSMAIYYELNAKHDAGHTAPADSRLYANGLDENTPSLYSAHPEHYADTPEQLQEILERQESDAAQETQPLLKPGGIGDPRRNYDTQRDH